VKSWEKGVIIGASFVLFESISCYISGSMSRMTDGGLSKWDFLKYLGKEGTNRVYPKPSLLD